MTQYHCNVCWRDITRAEFFYSKKHFGRALCREHQEAEWRKREKPEGGVIERTPSPPPDEAPLDTQIQAEVDAPKRSWKSLGKKIVGKVGKGIVKGVRKIVDYAGKQLKIGEWQSAILRRMTKRQLEQFCFELELSTTTEDLVEDADSEELYWDDVQCSKNELVDRVKENASLETIIAFANRNQVDIRDILLDIDRTEAKWQQKKLADQVKETGSKLLELELAIREFRPIRRYDKELYYQDTLYQHLKSKFPRAQVAHERTRASTRPDIVVDGIAIEVKGPTSARDLETIANKCMRYLKNFPKGLICVLFDLMVSPTYYDDWVKALEKTFPQVKIIAISS